MGLSSRAPRSRPAFHTDCRLPEPLVLLRVRPVGVETCVASLVSSRLVSLLALVAPRRSADSRRQCTLTRFSRRKPHSTHVPDNVGQATHLSSPPTQAQRAKGDEARGHEHRRARHADPRPHIRQHARDLAHREPQQRAHGGRQWPFPMIPSFCPHQLTLPSIPYIARNRRARACRAS